MKKYSLAEADFLAETSAQTSSNSILLNQEGQTFEVPVDGSLGLLACGYVGLMLWRDKKRERLQQAHTLETYYSSLNLSQDEK